MIATLMHLLGYGLCHQLPQRSFFGGGVQAPVCARDTGIYVGFVVSLLVMMLIDRRRRRSELPRAPILAIGGAFVAIMAWDGITSYAGLRGTTNDIRLITGLLTGWALPLVVVPLLNSSLWTTIDRGRVLEGLGDSLAWLLPIPVVFAAVRWGLPFLGVAYPLLIGACIVVTFVAVNLIIVIMIPRFERRAARIADAWPAMCLAALISAVEIGAAGWLRAWLQSLIGLR